MGVKKGKYGKPGDIHDVGVEKNRENEVNR